MPMPTPRQILLEPETLAQLVLSAANGEGSSVASQSQLLIVDVSSAEQYAKAHLPGAIHLGYSSIIRSEGDANGLLPDADAISEVFAALGITPDTWVIAYDQGGGGAASRLIWTMHTYHLSNCSLLNGGLLAWVSAGQAVSDEPHLPIPAEKMPLKTDRHNVVNANELMALIAAKNDNQENRGELAILDARSAGEYNGTDIRAKRGGHVPGAVNLEWTDALDINRDMKLLSDEQLQALVAKAGFNKDQTIVAYCQTHQRSSFSYVMLKHLGFDNVCGLEGSWSDWGNREDTPIET